MRELERRSSSVLMDLRCFSSSNRGCIYELGQLLGSIDLRRVVFVVDATTDRGFLDATLQQLWQQVPPDSPNLRDVHPSVQLFAGKLETAAGFRHLLQRLLACAE